MASEYEYFSDDITFCSQDDCHVSRCERHPSNIKHPELPHSYAMLYQTEYCPLEQKPKVYAFGEWIPCSERLPYKDGTAVLVTTENAEVYIDQVITDGFGERYFMSNTAFDNFEVIAWMPLPESYKGGNK